MTSDGLADFDQRILGAWCCRCARGMRQQSDLVEIACACNRVAAAHIAARRRAAAPAASAAASSGNNSSTRRVQLLAGSEYWLYAGGGAAIVRQRWRRLQRQRYRHLHRYRTDEGGELFDNNIVVER